MEQGKSAVEGMGAVDPGFWRGRQVLVTGHTGFKGAWATLWLDQLGARVTGYALAAPTSPSLFELARIGGRIRSIEADIRDGATLRKVLNETMPEVVLHFAAQSLVRESYQKPLETFEVNVLGTAMLLEAVRNCGSVRAVVIVTSDKCYDNREQMHAYRESDALGGRDPYSSSKACAELVAKAYRASFFSAPKQPQVATVRAGNVIGGGDWARDRLIPDVVQALLDGRAVAIRSPEAVRPWQHVLDPLRGYLLLAERLSAGKQEFAEAWNFGPGEDGERPVSWIVDGALAQWGGAKPWVTDSTPKPHEATFLKLDSGKSLSRLSWKPRLDLAAALRWTLEWYRGYRDSKDMRLLTLDQLSRYQSLG